MFDAARTICRMNDEKRVLIVDDDVWLTETFSTILEAHGWVVRVCHDAHKAIDVIDEWTPSVILLDLLLPSANGIGLLHELASHEDTRAIPVVLCTSLEVEFSLDVYGVYTHLDKAKLNPKELSSILEGATRAAD